MTYAERERKLISGNPLKSITWTEPRKLRTVDLLDMLAYDPRTTRQGYLDTRLPHGAPRLLPRVP
jgi:hypothetical protein